TVTDFDGEEFKLTGNLTIRGVTKQVEFKGEFGGQTVDAFGVTRAGFEASTEISREEFGLTWNAALEAGGFLVSDKVRITLDVSFPKDKEDTSDHHAARRSAQDRRAAFCVKVNSMSDQPVETLFLSTLPGATPSKWVHRFKARGSEVQLVTQDEQSQTLFLQPQDPPRYLPQLGYLRCRADGTWQDLVAADGLDPEELHLVRLYEEAPVIMVSKDHLLAAWTEDDGDVGADELTDETF